MHSSPSIAAHELWVELTTRISGRDLHFRSGREESAVDSIVSLFKTTRELMKQYPADAPFLELAAVMLETIRPYTARWHLMRGPLPEAKFLGPTQRHLFRAQLQQLQPQLQQFVALLATLKAGGTCQPPQFSSSSTPTLGANVPVGIDLELPPAARAAELAEINRLERDHVLRRRGQPLAGALENGTGLALSGGGIRSATFCLGVSQVLARAGLLSKFDYLSTVSGGGYFGAFLSNQFTAEDAADQSSDTPEPAAPAATAYNTVFTASPKDSPAVRHLRNSSKYLLPSTTLARLKLIGLLISGVLATTLLVMAVPVFCALLVHLLARWGWLQLEWPLLERTLPASVVLASGCGAITLLCWLVRPFNRLYQVSRSALDNLAALAAMLTGLFALLAATPWILQAVAGSAWQSLSLALVGGTTLLTGAGVVKAIGIIWKYRKALSRLFILSGALLFGIAYLATLQLLGWQTTQGSGITPAEALVSTALLLWAFWVALINLNLTGLHRYYRERLASCYLQDPPQPRDMPHPPPLEQLSAKLPYHLINTTVNLAASSNGELRGRGGDFFLFSKHYSGSTITGYRPTREVAAMNPDLDVATAMAISGAAASTNMGWQTLREYRTLMAIFNVRLGYWLRWRKDRWGWWASNACVQLGREILGLLDEHASTLNLSDGGHIENLGAYELIRRKVKFIVCVDGGMDGAMECADLNRLQRLVAIDFGYQIHFDAADLKPIDNFSNNYGLLAKIDYTPAVPVSKHKQLGWMLYIKLALLGTESNYVLDYRRQHPLFPHQSTADQCFDEAQFEAYRKLGETAALSFLNAPFASFDDWFAKLASYLLEDTDAVYER